MLHTRISRVLLFAALAWPVRAVACGPGEAAGRPRAPHIDFKVLVWYRLDDPLGTFKYQAYDLRRGQYTSAVDAWVKETRARFPAYVVIVRELDLEREKGQTERLKVGAVIKRELTVAAGAAGIFPGGPMSVGTPPQTTGSPSSTRSGQLPGVASQDRSYNNPSPTNFPVPVPYPRLPR
jgi:hypothetical protein